LCGYNYLEEHGTAYKRVNEVLEFQENDIIKAFVFSHSRKRIDDTIKSIKQKDRLDFILFHLSTRTIRKLNQLKCVANTPSGGKGFRLYFHSGWSPGNDFRDI